MKAIYFLLMRRIWAILSIAVWPAAVLAQPEVEPWGNMTGIRVDGQLMACQSSLRIIGPEGHVDQATAKERQSPKYGRSGKTQLISSRLDSLYFTEAVEEDGMGMAKVIVSCVAHADIRMRGVYFCVDLPGELSDEGSVEWIDPSTLMLDKLGARGRDIAFGSTAGGVIIASLHRRLEIRVDRPVLITGTVVAGSSGIGAAGRASGAAAAGMAGMSGRRHVRIEIPVTDGDMQNGGTAQASFSIKVSGEIDRAPVHVVLNTAVSGRIFEGLGGNFRIQNPRLDPEVIDYCLQHLRVAWGRVELPWRSWQPVEESDPLDSAKMGRLAPAVRRAMEMAGTLGKKKIPFILSAWFPPDWAVVGPVRFRPGADHVWGNPLNKDKMTAIYRSIADYIVFLKRQYKAEPAFFSFNESDLGINVRQTGQEHDALIKGLGAYFASRGLATRVLLGDNSDATTYAFVEPAMNDPAARPYIKAISFHSWRGCDSATLQKWSDDATALHVPLLVAEGSIDAAAWNYPAIFQEPTYALKEISLYTLLLSICQPGSILQWQLTTDYSLLAGGGIFGDTGVLRPTQRFWNLKQLSMTPPGLSAMALSCDRPNFTVAALGNNKRHLYVLHLVNTGAGRMIMLSGLPARVKSLRIYTTNQTESVREGAPVKVVDGRAQLMVDEQSYVMAISE